MADLTCRIVRPDRLLFEGSAASIILATYTGQLGIYPGHSSEICALGDGIVRMNKADGSKTQIIISGGYAEIDNDLVIVLADHARRIDDIDVNQVKLTRSEAKAKMEKFDEGDHRRAYYLNKINWCDLLLKYSNDEIEGQNY